MGFTSSSSAYLCAISMGSAIAETIFEKLQESTNSISQQYLHCNFIYLFVSQCLRLQCNEGDRSLGNHEGQSECVTSPFNITFLSEKIVFRASKIIFCTPKFWVSKMTLFQVENIIICEDKVKFTVIYSLHFCIFVMNKKKKLHI